MLGSSKDARACLGKTDREFLVRKLVSIYAHIVLSTFGCMRACVVCTRLAVDIVPSCNRNCNTGVSRVTSMPRCGTNVR